jgi:hypothetical protein
MRSRKEAMVLVRIVKISFNRKNNRRETRIYQRKEPSGALMVPKWLLIFLGTVAFATGIIRCL